MMSEKVFDNTNRCAAWPNQRKEKDTHPDLTGTINVGGTDHFFDVWVKWDGDQIKMISGKIGQAKTKGKSGGGYGGNSGSVGGTKQWRELRDNMPQRQDEAKYRDVTGGFDDDDIPF